MARNPKKARHSIRFLAIALLLAATAAASEHPHSIGGYVNFVTDSRLYPTPFSSNPVFHNDSYSLGGTLGFSAEYRYQFDGSVSAGLLVEYLPNRWETTDQNNTSFRDGFSLYLTEFSAYFTLPIGSERFLIHVGGGIGACIGRREYAIGGVFSRSTTSLPTVGIHVTSGFEYRISQALSLRAEMHFRNPEIVAENVFDTPVIHTQGYDYPVDTKPFKSKIDVNGNVYRIGVALNL
jgi:hypothetical protein